MAESRDEAIEFERLRSLLLGREAVRLTVAERQIRDLEAWVGDAPGLEAATAQILIAALKRAEIARHRELAAAIAPVVVAAIRSEIHNSRDMMVEALYPITGRLVAAAVANAFRDMLEAINQWLDALVSTNQWRLRLRALFTGRSVAEILLAEARASYGRILLLERGSGKLLAQWRPSGQTQDKPELLAGMIAAITEFASTVLSDRHGELRTLDLGARQLFLSASSRIVLAAEVIGDVSAKRRKRLDAGFLDLVVRHDRGESLCESDLAALAREPVRPIRGRGRGLRWAILTLVALAALGFALRGTVQRWIEGDEIEAAYHSALAADPRLANYPLTLEEDWSRGIVTLRGLAGSAAGIDAVLAALGKAARDMKVVSEVEIVATTADLRAAREAETVSAAGLTEPRAKIDAEAAALSSPRDSAAEGAAAEERARASRVESDEALASLDRRIGELASASQDAERRLDGIRGEIAALAGLPAKVDALDAAKSDLAAKTVGQGDALAALDRQRAADRAETGKVLAGLDQRISELASTSAQESRGEIAALADLPAKVGALQAATSDLRAALSAQQDALAALDRQSRADQVGAEDRESALRAELDAMSAGIDGKTSQVAAASSEAARRIDALRGEVEGVKVSLDEPRHVLADVVSRAIVLFGERDNPSDPEAAGKTLDAVADAIRRTGLGVRVIGYADESGSPAGNLDYSKARAAKVAKLLLDRGVSADRLVQVGRAAQSPIADVSDPRLRNRRVVFEPLFPDEPAP